MTNWRYYLKDDESTYPPIDNFSAILAIGFGVNVKYKFATYVSHKKGWVSEDGKVMRITRCCYTRIVGPKSVVGHSVTKCGLAVITEGYCGCDYEDDGYCFNPPKDHICKNMIKRNEYEVK